MTIQLPPLPKVTDFGFRDESGLWNMQDGFTHDQMKAYATAMVDAQAAEIAALRVDAERYRFVRDCCGWILTDNGVDTTRFVARVPGLVSVFTEVGEDLDELLSTAMKEQQK